MDDCVSLFAANSARTNSFVKCITEYAECACCVWILPFSSAQCLYSKLKFNRYALRISFDGARLNRTNCICSGGYRTHRRHIVSNEKLREWKILFEGAWKKRKCRARIQNSVPHIFPLVFYSAGRVLATVEWISECLLVFVAVAVFGVTNDEWFLINIQYCIFLMASRIELINIICTLSHLIHILHRHDSLLRRYKIRGSRKKKTQENWIILAIISLAIAIELPCVAYTYVFECILLIWMRMAVAEILNRKTMQNERAQNTH